MCNAISHHRLVLVEGGRIRCEKCWSQWDLEGRELVPAIRSSGQGSGTSHLSPRAIARLLVEELIERYQLHDRAEIRALKYEATQNSEVFIEQILGKNQP